MPDPTLSGRTELPDPALAAGLADVDLAPAWNPFFASLPVSTRLLLLGGPPLPTLAAAAAQRQGASWAVSSAVQAIDLPFADASFDAVAGQAVLESAPPSESLATLWRVLASGAEAQFLLAHTESFQQHAARWAQLECDIVLKQVHLFRRVHKLVGLEASTVTAATDRAGNELRAGLHAMKQALSDVSTRGGGRVLHWAMAAAQQLLRQRSQLRPGAAGLAVDRVEEQLRGVWRRAGALVALGRSPEQMQELVQYAGTVGFAQVECLHLTHPATGTPVTWQLLLRRP